MVKDNQGLSPDATTHSVTFNKLLTLSVLQFPQMQNVSRISAYLKKSLWGLNELMCVESLEQCLAQSGSYEMLGITDHLKGMGSLGYPSPAFDLTSTSHPCHHCLNSEIWKV